MMDSLMPPRPISTPDQPLAGSINAQQIRLRTWTVMQTGMQRGFTFQVLSLEDELFQAERDGRGFKFRVYPGNLAFRQQFQDYAREKTKSHKLGLMAAAGLSVPIAYGTYKQATDIPVDRLAFPLVVKPDAGSLSRDVFVNLHTESQLMAAAQLLEAQGDIIQVESYIRGRDYRVLIIDQQYAGCVERRPANVIGDGQHTIGELLQFRNQEPGRGKRDEVHTTIHQVVFDETSRRLLAQAGYTLATVLPAQAMCFLQEKIPAALGTDYRDCTDAVHPSIIEDCVAFSRKFSTLTLGFDLITSDLGRPLTDTGGAFNEYNFLPYVDLHENCNIGQKRPVTRLIWDYVEAHAAEILTPEFMPF